MLANETSAPMLKSMPPTRMTSIAPRPAKASGTICRARPSKFWNVRKCGANRLKTTKVMRSAATGTPESPRRVQRGGTFSGATVFTGRSVTV